MLFRSLDFSLGKNHDDVFFSLSLSSFNRVQLTVYCCNKAISPHWFDFIVLTKLLQVRTINGHTWIGRKTRAFKALNLLWTNNTAENRKKRTQAMAVSGRESEREKRTSKSETSKLGMFVLVATGLCPALSFFNPLSVLELNAFFASSKLFFLLFSVDYYSNFYLD